MQAKLRKPDASNRWRAACNFLGTAIGNACRAAAGYAACQEKQRLGVCVCVCVRERERMSDRETDRERSA